MRTVAGWIKGIDNAAAAATDNLGTRTRLTQGSDVCDYCDDVRSPCSHSRSRLEMFSQRLPVCDWIEVLTRRRECTGSARETRQQPLLPCESQTQHAACLCRRVTNGCTVAIHVGKDPQQVLSLAGFSIAHPTKASLVRTPPGSCHVQETSLKLPTMRCQGLLRKVRRIQLRALTFFLRMWGGQPHQHICHRYTG